MKKNKIFQLAAIGLASVALLAGCNPGESADKIQMMVAKFVQSKLPMIRPQSLLVI